MGPRAAVVLIVLIVLSCVLVGCAPSNDQTPQAMIARLEQSPEGQVLLAGITAQGGLEAWAGTQVLALRTQTKVFPEDGSIQTYVRRERFDIPGGNVVILSADDNRSYKLGIYQGSPYMTDAGKPVDDLARLRQAHAVCLNARYVASIPFVFAGAKTELESAGETVADGRRFERLTIRHPAWQDEQLKDEIVGYFDAESGRLERYLFADPQAPGQSILAILSDFRNVGPLVIPFGRDYWRADSEGNPIAILTTVTVEVAQYNPGMELQLFAPGRIGE